MWKGLLSVLYISCNNLNMLIDICHIYQIYLNYIYFYFWSKAYVWCFQFWRRFWDWNFLIVLWWILSFTNVCKFGQFCFSLTFFCCIFCFLLEWICASVMYHSYHCKVFVLLCFSLYLSVLFIVCVLLVS